MSNYETENRYLSIIRTKMHLRNESDHSWESWESMELKLNDNVHQKLSKIVMIDEHTIKMGTQLSNPIHMHCTCPTFCI